ncbi:MAG: hypothetical protein EAZ30_01655 [Betaproteobacteria bacterium]|nr:MAG: hypothetical protein EAZ30_01655 [Betaproteobacteria bacterium]
MMNFSLSVRWFNAALPLVATAVATVLAVSANVAIAQTSPSCPFTVAEVKQGLGIDVSAATPGKEMAFTGGKLVSCRYTNSDVTKPALWLNQTVMDDPKNPYNATSFKMMAGKLTPVPGDADGAAWQDNQGDLTNATLHYLRNGAIIELRVTVSPRDKAYADIRAKLPKLRRLPL